VAESKSQILPGHNCGSRDQSLVQYYCRYREETTACCRQSFAHSVIRRPNPFDSAGTEKIYLFQTGVV
jgi:hypothetical protein